MTVTRGVNTVLSEQEKCVSNVISAERQVIKQQTVTSTTPLKVQAIRKGEFFLATSHHVFLI